MSQALPLVRPGKSLNLLQDLIAYAQTLPTVRTGVVHPCDAVSLGAALEARSLNLIDPLLIGPRARIEAVAGQEGLALDGIEIIDVPHSHAAAAKGAELAAAGEVHAIMKGSLHTDELMSAILPSAAGLRTKRRVSHCFIMQVLTYPRAFIITDAAINIAPDLLAKADIVQNAIDLAAVLGLESPRVALLAAVETVSTHMPATLDAAILCKMADRGQISGGVLDGPLAFDNAISIEAAKIKGIRSEVAGAADILVAPDLESGNMLAKQLEYLGNAQSAGIVLGAKVPVVLTSRADPKQSRLASCAVAAILAQHYKDNPP
ncbi:bifunctional enoyl-CoA hydratase/phosphate acetyltransferase [Methylobacillus arboreus]|uniref:bifunctional enoyl-CoA hydratase/phosphate acetyltransferase n=1 Tax=Methylobacillus arboreus TaxID=755170 RepID=UPI001E4637F0|nr:bifunctional enoyl-CoA hydratase/phosphate acetyltransferase [Methylobacillus arboreus]MCB5191566.1 bifunctional enoyl-CoA hydratase/phosphate acetyltransferase [Methylobacillus arboreus]